jgi:hypothetical protein
MNILLMTTCVCDKEENLRDLKRLINSLMNQSDNIKIHHLILLQCVTDLSEINLDSTGSGRYVIERFCCGKMISLSSARNELISIAKQRELLKVADFVSFPDDDCWYPNLFWGNFHKLFINKNFDLFYTRFSSNPVAFNIDSFKFGNTFSLVQEASSNTTIYSSSIVDKVGFFDERFGVGASNNGGEDTDFAIRSFQLAKMVLFVDDVLIGHRDAEPQFRYRYYKGSFGVLKKHSFCNAAFLLIAIRKFFVGVVFLFSRKIGISDFFVKGR